MCHCSVDSIVTYRIAFLTSVYVALSHIAYAPCRVAFTVVYAQCCILFLSVLFLFPLSFLLMPALASTRLAQRVVRGNPSRGRRSFARGYSP